MMCGLADRDRHAAASEVPLIPVVVMRVESVNACARAYFYGTSAEGLMCNFKAIIKARRRYGQETRSSMHLESYLKAKVR